MQIPTLTTYPDGSQRWILYDQYHRLDGPAVIWADGTQYWLKNDELHRTDGPAVIHPDGSKEWWLDDETYSFNRFCRELKLTDEEIVFLKLKYNTSVSI